MNASIVNLNDKNNCIYNCIDLAPTALAVMKIDLNLQNVPISVSFDYVNNAFARLKNISLKNIYDVDPCSILSQNDENLLSIFYNVAYNNKNLNFKEYDKNTNKFLFFNLYQPKLGFCACVVTDITKIEELKETNRILNERLKEDDLTELLNRKYFISEIKYYLNNDENKKKNNALFIIDIDNFKFINDMYGHQHGDELLIELSFRLKKSFGSNDLIARLGGDEFIIFMKNTKSIEEVEKKADFLCRHLAISIKDKKVTCSIGVTISSEKNSKFEELYNQADDAMYIAKNNGKCQYYVITSYHDGTWIKSDEKD